MGINLRGDPVNEENESHKRSREAHPVAYHRGGLGSVLVGTLGWAVNGSVETTRASGLAVFGDIELRTRRLRSAWMMLVLVDNTLGHFVL